jgi:hypothetical protein
MKNVKALLPKLIAAARWLAFLVVVAASGSIAWKVAGIWQSSMGLFPDQDNAILGITSPWHPFYAFLLACFLCVLGAIPMLRERRSLSLPRLVFELMYFVLALYLMVVISDVLFYAFSTGSSGPAL